jgi:hypothetical protein
MRIADFSDAQELLRTERRAKGLGRGQLQLLHPHPLIPSDLAVGADQAAGHLVLPAQCGQQELRRSDLHRLVWPIGIFALQGDAPGTRRVEAHPPKPNVLGILGEVTGRPRLAHYRIERDLRAWWKSEAGRGRHQNGRTGERGRGGAGDARSKWHPTVIIQKIDPKLGEIQLIRKITRCDAVLTRVLRRPVGVTRCPDGSLRIERPGDADRGGIVGIRDQFARIHRIRKNGRDRIRCRFPQILSSAEPDKHVFSTGAQEIVAAEEGPSRIKPRLLPLEHPDTLHRQAVGEVLGCPEHVQRQQAFAKLGTRDAQAADVDRVQRVDAVLDEGAFAPVDDLPAQAQAQPAIADVEIAAQVGVEYLEIAASLVTSLGTETTLAHHGLVVEVGCADKGPVVAVIQFEIVRGLGGQRNRVAPVPVQVAVVLVDGAGGTPVRDPDQRGIRFLHAPSSPQ